MENNIQTKYLDIVEDELKENDRTLQSENTTDEVEISPHKSPDPSITNNNNPFIKTENNYNVINKNNKLTNNDEKEINFVDIIKRSSFQCNPCEKASVISNASRGMDHYI